MLAMRADMRVPSALLRWWAAATSPSLPSARGSTAAVRAAAASRLHLQPRQLVRSLGVRGLASTAQRRRPMAEDGGSGASRHLSISRGPTEPPLLTQTIPEHFASIVAKFPDRPAVIARAPLASPDAAEIAPPRETVYTYAALDRVSDVVAAGLRRVGGIERGDRVAVSLGNGPEIAVLTYALFKLGAVLVPLNPAFTETQVGAALSHLGVKLLVMGAVTDLPYKPGRGRSNLGLLQAVVGDLGAATIRSAAAPSLQTVVLVDNTADHPAVMGAGDFAQAEQRFPALTPFAALLDGQDVLQPDAVAALDPAWVPVAQSPEACINIQFTSGTTSQPKAAMLSHTAILNNGALIAHRMGLRPEDAVVVPPPLFHCFGSVLGYMATATTGAAILLPSPAFDPVASLQMAADHRAAGLYGVATMFVAMLEHLEGDRGFPRTLAPEVAASLPKHLRTGIAAGSSVPEALMRRLFAELGLHELVICYGMTETAPVSCMTAPTDALDKRTSTVGRVMPHTTAKIVDPEDRSRVLPLGQPGELAVSGYLLMEGYWGGAAETAAAMETDADGVRWMHSGDEATMDAEGYVAVTGRIKDLIIRGGENIHPLEIENCLFQHPLVAEVSVVGVADARYGEAVAAFVVPHGGVHVEGGVRATAGGAVETGAGTGAEATSQAVLTDEDVRAWVRERLSPHLVPKYVFWTAEYPKTASGKIQKFKLRDTAKKLLESS